MLLFRTDLDFFVHKVVNLIYKIFRIIAGIFLRLPKQ